MSGSKSLPRAASGEKPPVRKVLALLIAGHNEELVIANTIHSAIAGGMKPENIYVVDDNSSDATSKIARSILGTSNVCRVRRSGKGLALKKAAKKFELTTKYRWVHIADADGGFATNYFNVFRRELRIKYAAATGYVKSLPGDSVSQYRVYEYTIGMEIHRRFQALTDTVTVIPGPTSCFRSDIFDKVDFANGSLTEDFDVTLQIHRKRLGKVQFIDKAIAYTQDPRTLRDFCKQILRWNRGVMQGIQRHKIGRRAQKVDTYLTYQILQNLMFFVSYMIIVPYAAYTRGNSNIIATTFLFDVAITFMLCALVAAKARRWDILSAFPHIYLYRWVVLFVFLRSLIDVFVLRRFKSSDGTWANDSTRRYKPVAIG